jgi:hypothetical protein
MRSLTIKSKVVSAAERFNFYAGGSSAMKTIRNHKIWQWLVTGVCVLGLASPSLAVNIAWVSVHPGDNMPSTAATGFGFTTAPDKGYTDMLTAAGHTVTRIVASGTPDIPQLNTFDVVMISRSNNSGDFQTPEETARWASITKPVIFLNGYLIRGGTGGGSRLGLTTGETIPDIAATTTPPTAPAMLTINAPTHPIFAGVNTSQPYADIVTLPHAPNTAQRGVSVNTNSLAGNGTLLASIPALNGTTAGAVSMVIGEFPRGTVSNNSGQDVQLGNRLVFLTGSREAADQMVTGAPAATSAETSGIFDLSATGAQMLRNAVNYIATASAPVIGDVNGNGVTDINDYAIIRDNFNKPGNKGQGDLTGNGQVNFHDFRVWKNFAPPGVGSEIDLLAGLGIPEPGSVVLAMLAAISLAGTVARRGRR